MRDLKNKLTSGKKYKKYKIRKGKSFGYQVLGFGSGVGGSVPVDVDYLVVAGGGGGGGGGSADGGGAGAGGFRTSFPGGTKITVEAGDTAITVGAAGAGQSVNGQFGAKGGNSIIASLITSLGGGAGNSSMSGGSCEMNGGSGGGAADTVWTESLQW